MDYEEIPASPPLRPWVRCLWHLRGEAEPAARADRVVPDGCPEIVLQRGDPFREYQASQGPERVQAPRTLLAGQLTEPLWLTPTGRVDCLGIRFEPHGLTAFLDTPLAEITNARHDLRVLDADFADRLRCASTAAPPLAALQSELERRLRTRSSTPPSWIPEAVRRIDDHAGACRIGEWSVDLGVDPRRLQRGFGRAVGLTPKRLQRVLRFQKVYRRLEEATCAADLALECGYYDQAHMIRDFQQFAGRSPGRDPIDEMFSRLFAGI